MVLSETTGHNKEAIIRFISRKYKILLCFLKIAFYSTAKAGKQIEFHRNIIF